ncbi:hypothetical protein K8Q94_01015 [Candidatus Nomurabacteria bacterium]|nr:hypothetical protein [Candidatus Nomurabacteria bacterium]
MKKARIFLAIGIWTIVLPYLGFPIFWKNILFLFTGLIVIFFAYQMYKEYKILNKKNDIKIFDNFSENNN